MNKNDLLECINFFKSLEVSEIDVSTDEEKKKDKLAIIVTYKFKDEVFTTKRLYYQNIVNQDNIKYKQALIKHFGSPIYWLDIETHQWPQNSDDSNLEGLVIDDIINPGDKKFESFLKLLANNSQSGYIQRMTKDGRTGQYYHNLENNNHWHDLVYLIKAAIQNKGNGVSKKILSRLVFKWDGNKNTKRERSTLSYKPYNGGRKLLTDLYENILKIQPNLNKMEYNQLLENKKQIILQGPPGTGKTYTAQDMAYQLIFNEEISQESIQRKKDLIKLTESEYFDLVQFHPSYTYEDFVRGINVETNDGQISYKTKNKVFGDLIERANRNYDNSQKGTNELKEDQKPEEYLTNKGEDKQAIIQEKKFVLIIDEINRANLPSVLGELIYALEYRGVPVNGMYKYKGSRSLIVPPNIYIIGTMNTADRSVGHIDYAIRRRFSFVDILPNEEVIKDPDAKKLFNEVKALFMDGVLATDFDRKDVQLGHSYFMVKNKNELKDKFKYEILPILSEYIKDGILLKKAEDILIEIEQNVL